VAGYLKEPLNSFKIPDTKNIYAGDLPLRFEVYVLLQSIYCGGGNYKSRTFLNANIYTNSVQGAGPNVTCLRQVPE
jgi:hypothetical protein